MGEKYHLKDSIKLSQAQERSRVSEQLIHKKKMEAIGHLVAGIAHEFNNVLTPIIGNAQLARISIEDDYSPEAIELCLEEILKCAFRARDTIKQLIGFTGQGKYNPVDLNLSNIIQESSNLLKHGFSSVTPCSVKCEPEAENFIHADRSQIVQVINNLTFNALESMPEGGQIRIKSWDVCFHETVSGKFNIIPEGEYVELVVSDDGTGILDEHLDSIFVPFFSTKKGSRLVGLGLAVVWNIVKNYNGYITVDTKVGEGTSLHIYFPAVKRTIDAIKEVITGTGEAVKRILIVDDDDSVRRMASRYLKIKGYDTINASSGKEGLDIFKRGGIDLVLADLIMENMSGDEMCHEIKKVDPLAKIFIMSGYQKDVRVRDLLKSGAISFISKPFKLQDLGRIIKSALKDNNV